MFETLTSFLPVFGSKSNAALPRTNAEKAQFLVTTAFGNFSKEMNKTVEQMVTHICKQDPNLSYHKHTFGGAFTRLFKEKVFVEKELNAAVKEAMLGKFTVDEIDALYNLCQSESGKSAFIKTAEIYGAANLHIAKKTAEVMPDVMRIVQDEVQGKITLRKLKDIVTGYASEYAGEVKTRMGL